MCRTSGCRFLDVASVAVPLAVLVPLVVLAFSIGAGGKQGTAQAALVQTAAEEDAKRAPDFETRTLDNKTFRLSEAQGPVLLVFFAAWCPPCNAEAPYLQKLHEAYQKRGLHVIALGLASSREELQAFRETHEVTYPIGFDERNDKTAEAYGLRGFPTSFVLSHDQNVAAKFVGFDPARSPERLEHAVKGVLAAYEESKE